MEEAKNAIFRTLLKYDEEFLNRSPSEGKWSIIQILYHTIDVETQTLNYIKKKTLSPDKLEKAGIKEKLKSKILNFYLKAPMKWKAPAILNETPEKESLKNIQKSFDDIRSSWANFIREMPEDWADKKVFRHPISGRLDMYMTLEFLELHTKRHFGQIQTIIDLQSSIDLNSKL